MRVPVPAAGHTQVAAARQSSMLIKLMVLTRDDMGMTERIDLYWPNWKTLMPLASILLKFAFIIIVNQQRRVDGAPFRLISPPTVAAMHA